MSEEVKFVPIDHVPADAIVAVHVQVSDAGVVSEGKSGVAVEINLLNCKPEDMEGTTLGSVLPFGFHIIKNLGDTVLKHSFEIMVSTGLVDPQDLSCVFVETKDELQYNGQRVQRVTPAGLMFSTLRKVYDICAKASEEAEGEKVTKATQLAKAAHSGDWVTVAQLVDIPEPIVAMYAATQFTGKFDA